jgi:transposase-like protein
MRYPRCGGGQVSKVGCDPSGRQVYWCAACRIRQTDRSASAFRGYRFPV